MKLRGLIGTTGVTTAVIVQIDTDAANWRAFVLVVTGPDCL